MNNNNAVSIVNRTVVVEQFVEQKERLNVAQI